VLRLVVMRCIGKSFVDPFADQGRSPDLFLGGLLVDHLSLVGIEKDLVIALVAVETWHLRKGNRSRPVRRARAGQALRQVPGLQRRLSHTCSAVQTAGLGTADHCLTASSSR
jgi:hypothetical protein